MSEIKVEHGDGGWALALAATSKGPRINEACRVHSTTRVSTHLDGQLHRHLHLPHPHSLRLVSIARQSLKTHSWAFTRLLFHRQLSAGAGDESRFLNVTANAVEISVFADEPLVRKCFPEETGWGDRAEKGKGEGVEVSWDVWMALQVEQHMGAGDDWESAGNRVKELAGPLAADGISILFLSTYSCDYLLVKSPQLPQVFARLGAVGFVFNDPCDDLLLSPTSAPLTSHTVAVPTSPTTAGTAGMNGHGQSPFPSGRLRSGTNFSSSTPSVSDSPSRSSLSGSVVLSLSGSLVLSEHDGASSPRRGENIRMSRGPTREGSLDAISEEAPRGRRRERTETGGDTLVNGSPYMESDEVREEEEGWFGNVSILPDELITIGLDTGAEKVWMSDVIRALLFPEDVYPTEEAGDIIEDEEEDRHGLAGASSAPGEKAASQDSIKEGPLTPVPVGGGDSVITLHQLVDEGSPISPGPGPLSRTACTPLPLSAASSDLANPSHSQSHSRSITATTVTKKGFISLTQTNEESSLTADLTLLRDLFRNDDGSVYTVGEGGLWGRWGGEEEDEGDEESEDGVLVGQEQGRAIRACLQIDLSGDESFGLGWSPSAALKSGEFSADSKPLRGFYRSIWRDRYVVPQAGIRADQHDVYVNF